MPEESSNRQFEIEKFSAIALFELCLIKQLILIFLASVYHDDPERVYD